MHIHNAALAVLYNTHEDFNPPPYLCRLSRSRIIPGRSSPWPRPPTSRGLRGSQCVTSSWGTPTECAGGGGGMGANRQRV